MKIVCNGKPIKLELVEKGRAKKNNGSDIDGRGGRSFLSIFRRVFFSNGVLPVAVGGRRNRRGVCAVRDSAAGLFSGSFFF